MFCWRLVIPVAHRRSKKIAQRRACQADADHACRKFVNARRTLAGISCKAGGPERRKHGISNTHRRKTRHREHLPCCGVTCIRYCCRDQRCWRKENEIEEPPQGNPRPARTAERTETGEGQDKQGRAPEKHKPSAQPAPKKSFTSLPIGPWLVARFLVFRTCLPRFMGGASRVLVKGTGVPFSASSGARVEPVWSPPVRDTRLGVPNSASTNTRVEHFWSPALRGTASGGSLLGLVSVGTNRGRVKLADHRFATLSCSSTPCRVPSKDLDLNRGWSHSLTHRLRIEDSTPSLAGHGSRLFS